MLTFVHEEMMIGLGTQTECRNTKEHLGIYTFVMRNIQNCTNMKKEGLYIQHSKAILQKLDIIFEKIR